MTRPIIGIASRRIPFVNDNKPYPRYGVAISYCDAVERSGGIPIVFPLTDDKEVLDRHLKDRASTKAGIRALKRR